MNRSWAIAVVLAVFVAACAGAFLGLRRANHRRVVQLQAARAAHAAVLRREAENATLRRITERARTDLAAARRELDQEIARERGEVTSLEQQAQQQYDARLAARHAAAQTLELNRDLTKGPVLVEHCRNVGRATAVDAFQTLVWASARGDDNMVTQLIGFDGGARAMMRAMLANLPDAKRTKYATPEGFVALYVANNVSKVASLQVVKETELDPTHRVLEIARTDGKTTNVPMELGAGGWQLAIDGSTAMKIGHYLVGAEPPKH